MAIPFGLFSNIRFYIVRHGQTDWNKEKKLQGQIDIHLNDEGRSEAAELGKQLTDIPFAACYASDLNRAIETAHIIIHNRNMPLNIDRRLRERNYGKAEGMFWHDLHQMQEKPAFEKDEEMRIRVFSLFDTISNHHPNSNILIVTHSGLMKTLICHQMGIPCAMESGITVLNGGVLQLTNSDGQYQIDQMDGILIPESTS